MSPEPSTLPMPNFKPRARHSASAQTNNKINLDLEASMKIPPAINELHKDLQKLFNADREEQKRANMLPSRSCLLISNFETTSSPLVSPSTGMNSPTSALLISQKRPSNTSKALSNLAELVKTALEKGKEVANSSSSSSGEKSPDFS
ncbi:hypothetical protein RUND412_000594 [Rhizina undulata]